MDNGELINEVQSICPYCLKIIPARKVKYGEQIYLEKSCSEHGKFKTLIWDGEPSLESWKNNKIPAYPRIAFTKVDKGCPFDCGLCADHRQHTCTALIEVTKRCNLMCKFCFASSGDNNKSIDISMDNIKSMYNSVIKSSGICNIQLSGGEPTMRDDLPDIIKLGHDIGFEFIQVNTNGIRIASDLNYVKKLKKAGLNSIFLQFDGTNDLIYKKLRGLELLNLKIKAINNCKENEIGVILVPTLVPDVNMNDIGNIIDFGLANIPTVRGVHFQPVSYFGRFSEVPQNKRITIPRILRSIEVQTNGRVNKESFKPPGCENAFCSFHGNFIYKGNGNLMAITSKKSSCCEKPKRADIGAQKAKNFTARNWSGVKIKDNIIKLSKAKVTTWDDIIYNLKNSSFSISGMAFQDAWNFDIERIKDCCIHEVSPSGELIPFCAYNLTDYCGKYIYRNLK